MFCSIKCPDDNSKYAKAGMLHRNRSMQALNRKVVKAIEQLFLEQKSVSVEKDHYSIIQAIAYYYRSVRKFVNTQSRLSRAYWQLYGCHLNLQGAVKHCAGITPTVHFQLEPLAMALREIINALRYFSVLTRKIEDRQQIAANKDYVEAMEQCMKSKEFAVDPFDYVFGQMLSGKKPDIVEVIKAWRKDKSEKERQKDQDAIEHCGVRCNTSNKIP